MSGCAWEVVGSVWGPWGGHSKVNHQNCARSALRQEVKVEAGGLLKLQGRVLPASPSL